MSLDRIQVVRNFSTQVVVSQALDGTPTSPFTAAAGAVLDTLTTLQRVGRIRLVLAAGAAVTITDLLGTAYVVTNVAAVSTMIHEIPVINAHKNVKLSGSGTISVIVLAD